MLTTFTSYAAVSSDRQAEILTAPGARLSPLGRPLKTCRTIRLIRAGCSGRLSAKTAAERRCDLLRKPQIEWLARGLSGRNCIGRTGRGGFASVRAVFAGYRPRCPKGLCHQPQWPKVDQGSTGNCIEALTGKDAKYGFGRLIDLARPAPVAVAKHGRPVVVVMAVEDYERLKASAEYKENEIEKIRSAANRKMR